MKRKVNPVEPAPLPTCTAVGPEDMVLLACASGEVFLVERNCAIVSGYCRDLLQLWEGAVRRVAMQNKNDEHASSDAATTETTSALRTEVNSHSHDVDGPLATDPVEIPFMSLLDYSGSSPLDAIRQVPVTQVADHYQQRLSAADSTTPTKVDRPSSKQFSAHGDRKGMHFVVPKPISPLAPIEFDDGVPMYPVIVVPYMTPTLLEMALSYAQKKYKMDVDGEKAGTETLAPLISASAEGRWRLLAASMLASM
ncbi:hypothetical protein JKF63_03446 [Porcisia hertigi]|uniref:Uncharacterized protein n=1 Tax=Porcisia hertigi TaxID=2761500 RepID=A0A836HWA2_9TRYP|nr:hypothetical protein JKF63_03446 [Porcisia hertigi]